MKKVLLTKFYQDKEKCDKIDTIKNVNEEIIKTDNVFSDFLYENFFFNWS
jgi:hypothetical protein